MGTKRWWQGRRDGTAAISREQLISIIKTVFSPFLSETIEYFAAILSLLPTAVLERFLSYGHFYRIGLKAVGNTLLGHLLISSSLLFCGRAKDIIGGNDGFRRVDGSSTLLPVRRHGIERKKNSDGPKNATVQRKDPCVTLLFWFIYLLFLAITMVVYEAFNAKLNDIKID